VNVQAAQLSAFERDWRRCAPLIEAALEHAGGGHELADVLEGVRSGEFHFWAGEWSAVITEFIVQPHLKTLNFWLLGGCLQELMTMRPQIEAWAEAHGCKRCQGGGVHAAWGRVLAKAGYLPRWTIYVKELGK
jgi:hypothetical protein